MVKEYYNLKMVMFMKVIFLKMNVMERVNINLMTIEFFKDNGKIT